VRLIASPLPSAAYAVAHWAIHRGRSARETSSASYCYSVWLRHIVRAAATGLPCQPRVVGELGPGASLGVGLCALLTGAERYVALDTTPYAATGTNLQVFDELVELLRGHRPVPPVPGAPALPALSFPTAVLTDHRLGASLDPGRVASIRARVAADGIDYLVPWDDRSVLSAESLDMVVSQAVMEHVEDLPRTYAAVAAWLRPGGVASHQVDLRCHDRAMTWNGHWAYPDWLWRFIRGRHSPINRQPASRHVEAIARPGLRILTAERTTREDGLRHGDLDRAWRWLDDEDLRTAGLFVQALKPLD
jgi:SAM-dependent methyltransferase